MSEEYDLAKSKEKLGALVPILTDAHGNIIDGFHRQKVDPDWPKLKVDHITDPVQLDIARLASNVCRRTVPAEEKTRLLGSIAKLTKWTPQQIADAMGMTVQWVLKYIPDKYKERPEVGGPKKRQKTDEIRPEFPVKRRLTQRREVGIQRNDWGRTRIYTCSRCGNSTVTPIYYGADPVCAVCDLEIQRNPKLVKEIKPEGIRPAKPAKVEKREYKVKEPWERRQAVMHPKHSKIEEALRIKLEEKGFHPIVDHDFCLQSTTPDFYFKDKNLAVYVDGKVHEGHENRDQYLRELLTKRHGIRVVSVKYDSFTEKETGQVFTQILEEVSV